MHVFVRHKVQTHVQQQNLMLDFNPFLNIHDMNSQLCCFKSKIINVKDRFSRTLIASKCLWMEIRFYCYVLADWMYFQSFSPAPFAHLPKNGATSRSFIKCRSEFSASTSSVLAIPLQNKGMREKSRILHSQQLDFQLSSSSEWCNSSRQRYYAFEMPIITVFLVQSWNCRQFEQLWPKR
jgi:hypothetical protein